MVMPRRRRSRARRRRRRARSWPRSTTSPDPEIPAVSIVELGMIGDDRGRRRTAIASSCCRRSSAARRSRSSATRSRPGSPSLGAPVRVDVSFATPWTSDRISPAGREKLRALRLRAAAAPAPTPRPCRRCPMLDRRRDPTPVACPYCGSLADDPRERLRADPVPLDPPLRRLPPAVRGVQARSIKLVRGVTAAHQPRLRNRRPFTTRMISSPTVQKIPNGPRFGIAQNTRPRPTQSRRADR